MPAADLLVASNRGPLSFTESDDGSLVPRRGGGGLVSGLSSVGRAGDTVWVCAALTDADRAAARQAPSGRLDQFGHDTGGAAVRMLDIAPSTFARAYNAVANSTLWFVHHLLYATPVSPAFASQFRREWESYREYNLAFAQALAEEAAPDAKVLVQDYHLSLVPGQLRELRPDLRIAHFSHTPWAPPEYFDVLPGEVGTELLAGLLGADHAGFHSRRWTEAFAACCAHVLGAKVDPDGTSVTYDGRTTALGIHPLGVDAEEMQERAHREDVEARRASLLEQLEGKRTILRIDRTELSKNIARGLQSYGELLRTHPEWHEKVVLVAFAYPSRHDLPEYREYTGLVQRLAAEIVDDYGTDTWRPVLLQVDDDYPRSLAAYRIADVLLVNPLRDGMNLVAKEGPVLSEKGVALVLSTQAGAADELGADAFLVNPYDISGTAEALHEALLLPEDERAARSARLREAATALPPQDWFAQQVAALG